MTTERPPESGPQFEAMMAQIDFKLTQDGVDIPGRSMLAVREVSLRYNLSIPLGGDPARLPRELAENLALSNAIMSWYDNIYGDRQKIDFCPGRTVVEVDGDLYVMRIPRAFGSARYVVGRNWLDTPDITRGPVKRNVVQLLEDMTPAKAARLSAMALDSIAAAFETALPASYTLENTSHDLMRIARGDVDVAVSSLMVRHGRYGESKWASLQAAEKIFKAAIELAGGKYTFTHVLVELEKMLAATGLVFDARVQIVAIQCQPAIRYGKEPCTRAEVLAAHQASLELVNILRDAGAKFELGIGGIRRSS
jgi:hypothetical protein